MTSKRAGIRQAIGGVIAKAKAPSDAARFADAIIQWTLLVLAALMPVFFLPWTVDALEPNKQLLLFIGAGIAGVAWIGKMLAEQRIEYRKSFVNPLVILYVAIYGVSAWISMSPYTSFVGGAGQEMSGFFSVLAMATLYFVIVNNVRSADALRRLFSALMLGGLLAAVFGLLQGLGIYVLPFGFAKTAAFNTVGTAAAMGMASAFMLALIGGALFMGYRRSDVGRARMLVSDAVMVLTAVLSLLLIAAIDFWAVNAALLIASIALIAFAFVHARALQGIGGILLPIASLVFSLMLLITNFPIGISYPPEVTPSLRASWDIAQQTLQERPLFGSGPGTFAVAYAQHRTEEVNRSPFWNIRFDRSASHALTELTTVGILGAAAWIALIAALLYVSLRRLLRSEARGWQTVAGVFSAWLLLIAGKFFYSSTLTLEFLTWMMMALLVVVTHEEWRSTKLEASSRSTMTLTLLSVLALAFFVLGSFAEGRRYVAGIHYARAIANDRSGGEIDRTLAELARATELDPRNDAYLRDAALGMLAKADGLLRDTPAMMRNDGESDEDFAARQKAATNNRVGEATRFAAGAVNVAKAATELGSTNVENWSVLGSVYQNLLGTTDSVDEWAITAYETASGLEPANPVFPTELGKTYLWQAAREVAIAEEGAGRSEELLQKAVDAFDKAIALKADYAPAYYHQGVAYEQQGRSEEAISRLEAVVALSPDDVGTGFHLALLYFRSERKDDAILLLESVVRIAPEYANARWYLAAMYEDAGRFTEALGQVTEVAKLDPGNALVQQKLVDLKAMGEGDEAAGGEGLPEPVQQ